jgi:EmrB/QacA subfamily drug resistance transporter
VQPTPPGYLLPRRATLLALVGVLLGMLLAILNQTIVATALPTIVADLGGSEHYSWVFTAYMLAVTVSVPIYGKLSDLYGRRRFFVIGLVTFMAGTVIAGSADSMTQMIAGRAVQGVGAGGLIPMAMAVIGDLIPASERGRWQGLTGAVFGIGSILGPLAGGWISDNADWRWVFFGSLPLGLLALAVVGATLRLPPRPERENRIDYTGAALLIGGLSSGLLAIAWGGQEYPWGSVTILGLFAASVTILTTFVVHERRAPEPIVPIDLISRRIVAAGCVASFGVGFSMFAGIMVVPLFVQGVLGSSATDAGLVLAPLMLGFVVASIASGQLISRTGRYRWALLLGPWVGAAGFVLLSGLDARSTTSDATVAMIVLGLGLGLMLQNLVLAVQNGVPGRFLGVVTSSTQVARSVGGTIGVTLTGTIIASGLPGTGGIGATLAGSGVGGGAAAREQLADAIHPVFLLGLPVMAVTFAVIWLVPDVTLRRSVHDDDEPIPATEPEVARRPARVTPEHAFHP